MDRSKLEDLKQQATQRPSREVTDQVLAKNIDWNTHSRNGLISSDAAQLLATFDREKRNKNAQQSFLTERGPDIAGAFVEVLDRVTSDSGTVQYTLTVLEEMFRDDRRTLNLFTTENLHAADKLFRLLRSTDSYTVDRAIYVLSALLSSDSADVSLVGDLLTQLTSWNSNSAGCIYAVINGLMNILQVDKFRPLFVSHNGIKFLLPFFKTNARDLHLMYEIIFCFWLLSYNEECAIEFGRYPIVNSVVDLLKTSVREKVVRVSLAMFKNLLNRNETVEQMVDRGLVKVLEAFAKRKWKDEELGDDLGTIKDTLHKNIRILTSFERYQKELQVGQLEWSFVHSEKFWKENVMKFEENDFKILRQLIALLSSDDAKTVAVACFDIGEFSRFHPQGKIVLQRLGAKLKVMQLMAHADKEVAKQALFCVQKLVVGQYEVASK